MAFSVVDLFCGCGGLSLGFEAAGFEILGGNDFDDEALIAFRRNHPAARAWPGPVEDITSASVLDDIGLGVGELDVLIGGPPCQGFSQNRARRHIAGQFVDDPRNHLFKEFLRFVEDLQPRAVVIENVPQLLIKQGGAFWREISERLGSLGYATEASVLNSVDYGVPQRRRRAVILAARDGRPQLPSPTHGPPVEGMLFGLEPYVTIWDAISDLPRLDPGYGQSPGEYASDPTTVYQKERRGSEVVVTEHVAWVVSKVQAERISYLGEGDRAEKLPAHLRPKSGYGSAYRRMARNIPALTITTWMYHAGSGMFVHPVDNRIITLREGARLQSFDDTVQFVGGKTSKCRQVGNAVPPLLAKAIAGSVSSCL